MPIARGDKEYRLPVKGLNTEVNVLDFPQEFAVDINNLSLEFNPVRMKPRLGHTSASITEVGTSFVGTTGSSGSTAMSWFLWEQAGDDENSNFIAVQIGDHIIFIDADSDGLDSVPSPSFFSLTDALSGTSKGSGTVMETQAVQYTNAKGHLIVTGEGIDPCLIQYDPAAGTFSYNALTLRVRDIIGLESGIGTDFRPVDIDSFPVGSSASILLADLSEEHEYNLYNQGWSKARRLTSGSKTESNPIVEFNTQNSEYPSNADISYLGMVDDTGDLIFDAEYLKDLTFGSSPAARGYFVVDAFSMDRQARARAIPIASGAGTGGGGTGGGFDLDWNPITGQF